ncbi:MAG: hypothetical protein ACLFRO_08170 [Desulfobacterales bacterium]
MISEVPDGTAYDTIITGKCSMFLFILMMSLIVVFLYGLRVRLLMTRRSHPNADLLISELEKLCK